MHVLRSLCWLLAAATGLSMTGASATVAAPPSSDPLDWTHWRGPEQNGVSREKGLIDSWDPKGKNLLWKNEALGTRSTPIVMNGKVYTICRGDEGQPSEGEKVVCADAATGKLLWENKFNVFLSDVPAERVGWSSVVGDPESGRVYALSVGGYFLCVDGETGETVWSRSLSEESGLLTTYGGRTNFPILFEDLVIINGVTIGWGDAAKPAHRFLAFNKDDGQLVWMNGTTLLPDDTTYSTPFVTTFNGQAAMVFGSGDGKVWAFQPRTGQPIWSYDLSLRGLNTSPIVVDGVVYMGQSEENRDDNTMGAFVAINGAGTGDITESGEIWRVKELMIGKSSPLYLDGRLYVLEDGNGLHVLDAATGKSIGRKQRLVGTITRASPVYADGRIYVCTTSAWHVLEPTESGVKLTQRLRFPDGEEIYASPIVSHGRIYFTTTAAMYCLGQEGVEPSADPLPQPPAEAPLTDKTPALVQVTPAELLLRPGDEAQFSARLFNKQGQLLGETPAKFSLEGPGQIDDSGRYAADSAPRHSGVNVVAKVGDLEGHARLRVIPSLPWEFDFDSGEVPVTWVGARYRHIAIDQELLDELKAADPKAAQLYIYLMTGFINNAAPAAKFDETYPRRTWAALLRYMGLEGRINSLEQAKATLEPALKLLEDKQVISKHVWGANGGDGGGTGVSLAVQRGPRPVEGNGVMCKITTIPKGTRSQGWMGHPDFHDYTIQADVCGGAPANVAELSPETAILKMPDIALIAQRYTFDMMGASQQLQIRSWTPQLDRFSKSVPFAWQPNTWYTLKFQASTDGERAILRGKAWVRGEPEPEEWTIEAIDEYGNLVGSPGLFGNAKDSEIYLDNIQLKAN